jgi:hypothetical protein
MSQADNSHSMFAGAKDLPSNRYGQIVVDGMLLLFSLQVTVNQLTEITDRNFKGSAKERKRLAALRETALLQLDAIEELFLQEALQDSCEA